MKKTLLCMLMSAALLCSSTTAAFAGGDGMALSGERITVGDLVLLPEGEAAIAYENEGLKLLIPVEYDELLLTEVPENDPDGVLFSVSEKASLEAAGDQIGAGQLFRIVRISGEEMRKLRCNDMSGAEIFASDTEGNYYVYAHPTDVRFVRENYDDVEEDMKQWTELNEWAWSKVRDSFVAENGRLEAETYGNTEADIFLARIAFGENESYTVSTTQYGPKEPKGLDPMPYLKNLITKVSFEDVDLDETPDGEYVVLNFPDEGIRFDFFLADGKKNYVRQVWGEDNERLYLAVFEDEKITAADVMQEWYDALVANEEMRNLGITPDALLGQWAEKIAGRGEIDITAGSEPESYHVEIHWGSSAFETSFWEMTAKAIAANELRYENGRMFTLSYDQQGNETRTENYTDGSGTFTLLSTNELVWDDETAHAADDCLFVSIG